MQTVRLTPASPTPIVSHYVRRCGTASSLRAGRSQLGQVQFLSVNVNRLTSISLRTSFKPRAFGEHSSNVCSTIECVSSLFSASAYIALCVPRWHVHLSKDTSLQSREKGQEAQMALR
jgi:hypothetical protein